MKRTLRLGLLAMLLALTLAVSLASCGKQPTPPEPTVYTVTFSVNGQNFTQTVEAGSVPSFTGSTDKASDGNYIYTFVGWDKPIVPATEDVTYTAQYSSESVTRYTVTWFLRGGRDIIETYPEGAIPTPPDVPPEESDGYIYTFSHWDTEFEPIYEDTFIYARYTQTPKLFPVTFRVDGTVVAVVDTPYNTVPVYPNDAPRKDGMHFAGWTLTEPITGAAVSDAVFSHLDPEATKLAVKMVTEMSSGGALSSAVLYLALQEFDCPNLVTEHVLSYVRSAYTKSNPHFDLAPNFFYPSVAAILALVKNTPTVWDQLTPAEIEQLDWMMRGFAVMSAIGTDDAQNYTSGPGFTGNYGKTWNPNYRLANVTPILFCVDYFGSADAVNQILADFDYDTYIAKFEEYNWTSALSHWTHKDIEEKLVDPDGDGCGTYTTITNEEDVIANSSLTLGSERVVQYVSPKTMLMEGGEVFCITSLGRIGQWIGKSGGSGLGVPAIGKKGYVYMGHPLSDVGAIWDELLLYNYDGGKVISSKGEGEWRAYIEGDLISPYQGLYGMMKEFNSGARSSAGYCKEDFNLVMTATAAFEALNLYDTSSKAHEELFQMMWIGNNDLIYKLEKGYWSFSGTQSRGKPSLVKEDNNNGYLLWKSYWLEIFDDRYTLEFFESQRHASIVTDVSTYYSKPVSAGSTPDVTITGGYSGSVKSGKEYWNGNAFIFEFSLRYDENLKNIGIRLRTGSNREDLIVVSPEGRLYAANGSMHAVAGQPDDFQLEGYGWHRIAVLYEQKTTVNASAKTVTDTFTFTVMVDGRVVTAYEIDANLVKTKGWQLYSAAYDESQPGSVKYTANASTDPYWQIYSGGVFNNPDGQWFIELGDMRTSCGTAPQMPIARVIYHTEGGEIVQSDIVKALGGYVTEYQASPAAFYVSTSDYTLPEAVREGYKFVGWYDNAAGEGFAIRSIKAGETDTIELYAVWALADEPSGE